MWIQSEADRHRRGVRKGQLHWAAMHPWPASLLHRLLLHTSYALSDHTRNALILSVFGFKVTQPASVLACMLHTSLGFLHLGCLKLSLSSDCICPQFCPRACIQITCQPADHCCGDPASPLRTGTGSADGTPYCRCSSWSGGMFLGRRSWQRRRISHPHHLLQPHCLRRVAHPCLRTPLSAPCAAASAPTLPWLLSRAMSFATPACSGMSASLAAVR